MLYQTMKRHFMDICTDNSFMRIKFCYLTLLYLLLSQYKQLYNFIIKIDNTVNLKIYD